MRKKYVQLSLFDIYTDVLESIEENKPKVIKLIDEYIDFESFIPHNFYRAYYRYYGRKRINPLESYIRFLILQKLLKIPQTKVMLNVLSFSKQLQDFCSFNIIPDESQISRFKSEFCDLIVEMFENLVEITVPIRNEIDSKKAEYLIFDTTGIEPYVKENNPKFYNTKLTCAKNIKRSNPNYNPYIGVYNLFPDEAEKAKLAKHQYINGHFCYAYKAAVITDGLGIIQHISFFDEDFRNKHPEIISKKSGDPEKDKEVGDSIALKPVLSDFFKAHPDFHYSTFLGDSAFDSYDIYTLLKNDFHFSRVCVPLNPRNSKSSSNTFNEYGNPICPVTKVQFTCLGKSGGKNRSLRYKWVCPESKAYKNRRICTCKNPCTNSTYGKCTYTYPEKNFRECPGIPRNTEHWNNLYKHRIRIERTINIFKDSFALDSPRTQNPKTIKADLYLAGCVQLIGVILAKSVNNLKLYKSISKLIS